MLKNASFATSYEIRAPSSGLITDGGFIFGLASPGAVRLTGVQLLDRKEPSALHLGTVGVLPLGSSVGEAIGLRPGALSALSPANAIEPLAEWSPRGAVTDYELLLVISVPKGSGPWAVTGLKITYSLGSVNYYSIFTHELRVCGAAQVSCAAFGTASTEGPSLRTLERTGGGGCMAGTSSWASGKPVRAWLATNVHSPYWEGSGGNIALSTTRAASFSMQTSDGYQVSASVDAGIEFGFFSAGVTATAQKNFGVALTRTVSTTSSWQYTLTVPANAPTERATVYIYGWALPVTTETISGNCSTSYSYGTVYAPDANTNPGNDYCIAVETYPGVADLGPTCHSG
jgi:hypothetical protein